MVRRKWEPPVLDDRFVNGRDRRYFKQLTDAYTQVAAMSDLGVISEDLLDEIQDRIERAAALIEADGATSALGGRRNRRIRPYVGELTKLMVDLVDAAVQHQAEALHNDVVVSVTLKELKERHAARAAGHREVSDW